MQGTTFFGIILDSLPSFYPYSLAIYDSNYFPEFYNINFQMKFLSPQDVPTPANKNENTPLMKVKANYVSV